MNKDNWISEKLVIIANNYGSPYYDEKYAKNNNGPVKIKLKRELHIVNTSMFYTYTSI
jgi:hypothetical protein